MFCCTWLKRPHNLPFKAIQPMFIVNQYVRTKNDVVCSLHPNWSMEHDRTLIHLSWALHTHNLLLKFIWLERVCSELTSFWALERLEGGSWGIVPNTWSGRSGGTRAWLPNTILCCSLRYLGALTLPRGITLGEGPAQIARWSPKDGQQEPEEGIQNQMNKLRHNHLIFIFSVIFIAYALWDSDCQPKGTPLTLSQVLCWWLCVRWSITAPPIKRQIMHKRCISAD